MERIVRDLLPKDGDNQAWYLIGYLRGHLRVKDSITLEEWNEACEAAVRWQRGINERLDALKKESKNTP